MRPVRDCLIPDCGPKPIKGRGLCSTHYTRLRDYGDPLREPTRQPKTCTVEGCEKQTRAKSYCQMHYLRFRKYGDPNMRLRHWSPGPCLAGDCEKPRNGPYCKMHASRMARTGTLDLKPRTGRHTNAAGYELVKMPGHPVAQANGWAYEHRVVLYDAIGEGPHPCHWCGKSVCWHTDFRRDADYLIVDHLDNNPSNNDRDNLAPSCSPCNTVHSYVISRERVAR